MEYTRSTPEPPDEFGVPTGFFGHIDPDFCAALSRVVMLGALLEDRLWTLLTQLKTPAIDGMIFEGPAKNVIYQSTYAGRTAGILIKHIRGALEGLEPQFRHHVAAGNELMDDAQRLFEERNSFVHNVWSRPTLDHGYGHRGIDNTNRQRLSKEVHEFHHDFVVTRETFTTVITQMVRLFERICRFELQVKIPS